DIKSAFAVERDAVRLIELRFGRSTAIATEAWTAGPSNRGNLFRVAVDSADDVVFHFDKEHVAVFVETDFIRFVELRLNGESTVAGVAATAATGNRGKSFGLKVEASNAVVVHFRNVQCAVWSNFDAEW